MIYTQKQINDYLEGNPLQVSVAFGNVSNMNGRDYILVTYQTDDLIGSDDKGIYQSYIQITIATKDFANRKRLVDYVKDRFNVSIIYEKSDEFEYYLAHCDCGLLICQEARNI